MYHSISSRYGNILQLSSKATTPITNVSTNRPFVCGNAITKDLCKKILNQWYTLRDVIMSAMASEITSLTIVYSTVYTGADQRRHQSSASLAFARGIHRRPVNSPHKWPITRNMFPLGDVIVFVTGEMRMSMDLCNYRLCLRHTFGVEFLDFHL